MVCFVNFGFTWVVLLDFVSFVSSVPGNLPAQSGEGVVGEWVVVFHPAGKTPFLGGRC